MTFKTILIALLLITWNKVSLSQNTVYSEIYNHNTGIRADSYSPGRTVSCTDNGILFSVATRAAIGKDAIKILAFDTKTKKSEIHIIPKVKELKKLFNEQIETIAHIQNKLVLIAFDYIYIFKPDKNQEYKLSKMIKNEGSFLNLQPLNNEELLCSVNYQYHPLDENHMHTWAKLNVAKDSLGPEYYFDEENVRFSTLPNRWISAYNGLIAYAHTTDYKVLFYNSNFSLIDSIQTDALRENKTNLLLIPDGTDYSLEEMKKIGQMDDSLLTRIEKVFLLDSTRLLVIQKQPRTHYLKYDLWKKSNGSWEIVKSQSLPGYHDNGVAYSAANNSVIGFYGNFPGLSYAGHNEFYVVYYPYMENPITKSFDSQRDYYDKTNELMRKNQLFYGIKKLKIIAD